MSDLPPPLTHRPLRDKSPRRHVQVRLMQIAFAAGTIFATAWCYQLHIALGLTATFLAKHILVAILAAALRLPIQDVDYTPRGPE